MKILLLTAILLLPALAHAGATVAGPAGALLGTGNAGSTTYEFYLLGISGTVLFQPCTTPADWYIGEFEFPAGSPTLTNGFLFHNGSITPIGKAGSDALLAFFTKIGQ